MVKRSPLLSLISILIMAVIVLFGTSCDKENVAVVVATDPCDQGSYFIYDGVSYCLSDMIVESAHECVGNTTNHNRKYYSTKMDFFVKECNLYHFEGKSDNEIIVSYPSRVSENDLVVEKPNVSVTTNEDSGVKTLVVSLRCGIALPEWYEFDVMSESDPFFEISDYVLNVSQVNIGDIEMKPSTVEEISYGNMLSTYEKIMDFFGIVEYSAYTKYHQMFQSDYWNVSFSGGTVRSHGCGISSFSMVASYLLGEDITPGDLARKFNSSNPAAAMEAAFRYYNLNPVRYFGDAAIENIFDAVDSGFPVIALYNKNSIFTDTGHFVFLSGVIDGKYIVYDPNKFNYQGEMTEKYKDGFSKEEILKGLSGCYVFEYAKENGHFGNMLDIYTNSVQMLLDVKHMGES